MQREKPGTELSGSWAASFWRWHHDWYTHTNTANVPEMMLVASVEKDKNQNWVKMLLYQLLVLQSCLGLELPFGEESSQLDAKISLHNTLLTDKCHNLDSSEFGAWLGHYPPILWFSLYGGTWRNLRGWGLLPYINTLDPCLLWEVNGEVTTWTHEIDNPSLCEGSCL